jgi:hypothetical protein
MTNTDPNRGTPQNPSESRGGATSPSRQGQQQEKPKEGDFRNIETTANNPSSFDDGYAVEQEEKISEHEASTEDENRGH